MADTRISPAEDSFLRGLASVCRCLTSCAKCECLTTNTQQGTENMLISTQLFKKLQKATKIQEKIESLWNSPVLSGKPPASVAFQLTGLSDDNVLDRFSLTLTPPTSIAIDNSVGEPIKSEIRNKVTRKDIQDHANQFFTDYITKPDPSNIESLKKWWCALLAIYILVWRLEFDAISKDEYAFRLRFTFYTEPGKSQTPVNWQGRDKFVSLVLPETLQSTADKIIKNPDKQVAAAASNALMNREGSLASSSFSSFSSSSSSASSAHLPLLALEPTF